MDMKNLLLAGAVSLVAAAVSTVTLFSKENTEVNLTKESRIALVGENMMEHKDFGRFFETYLVACTGLKGIRVHQFGGENETAARFVKRMEEDTAFFKPDVTITFFGTHDSGFRKHDKKRQDEYIAALTSVIRFYRGLGSRVIVASPYSVDPNFFRPRQKGEAEAVNNTFQLFSQAAYETAIAEKVGFLDVFHPFADYTRKGKEKFGASYHLAGNTGANPWWNGQMVIAYLYLKKLGFGKEPVADIVLDMNGKESAVSAGHTIVEAKEKALTIKSERYPYCFRYHQPLPKKVNPGDIRFLFQFLPFHQDLNMFRLRVTNLTTPKAKVQWGKDTKEFTKEQLEQGINLAEIFTNNPFSGAFEKVQEAVRNKQSYEYRMYRSYKALQNDAIRLGISEKGKAAFATVIEEMRDRYEPIAKRVDDAVVPVTHTITVIPVQ